MNNYISIFNEIANKQKGIMGDDDLKMWKEIDQSYVVNVDKVIRIIRNTFKKMDQRPLDVVGNCFNAVNAASFELLNHDIKHIVTIGDVVYKKNRYFGTTYESLKKEMDEGESIDRPANAHAWITLLNGVVIDITILSSLALKNNKKPIKWNNAIHYSRGMNNNISHIPLMLGAEYMLYATIPKDEFSQMFTSQWIDKSISVLFDD